MRGESRIPAVFFIVALLAGGARIVAPSDPLGNDGLEYFGFAVVDCGFDDPSDGEMKTNYVDEVAGFTNVAQMCVATPEDSVGSRLALFQAYGVRSILYVESLLFERREDPSSPSGVRVTLRDDAESRWTDFVDLNVDVLAPKYVAALYLVDEPVWNGVSWTDFTRALQIVKASLPGIPTMAVEAYPVLDRVMVPESLDWIGFDRYDSADPEHDWAYLADLATVSAARTRDGQRIVIVASTQWLPYYLTDAGIRPEDMGAVAWSYYRLAASHPEVVALIGYLWPGGLDDPEQLGARNLPDGVRQSLRVIGEKIVGHHGGKQRPSRRVRRVRPEPSALPGGG